MIELGPAELFRADAEGDPGERTFFIHATANGEPFFFISEKHQVAALGELSLQFLSDTNIAADDEAVDRLSGRLQQHVPLGEPYFRVSGLRMAIGESEMITVALESVDPDDEEVTFMVAPEQLKAAAEHALSVVESGRPICPLCDGPKEATGHSCPPNDRRLN